MSKVILVFVWMHMAACNLFACECENNHIGITLNDININDQIGLVRIEKVEFTDSMFMIEFNIIEHYKGDSLNTKLIVDGYGTSCDYNMRIGELWLLFAQNERIDICSKSQKILNRDSTDFLKTHSFLSDYSNQPRSIVYLLEEVEVEPNYKQLLSRINLSLGFEVNEISPCNNNVRIYFELTLSGLGEVSNVKYIQSNGEISLAEIDLIKEKLLSIEDVDPASIMGLDVSCKFICPMEFCLTER